MDKLIIPNGGMFFEGDDIRWLYGGLEAALGGVLAPFFATANGNCILSGCDISFAGGNASVTAGWVLIGGEVCYCAAQTVAVTSLAASSLKVAETYDPDGLEVFADSVSRNTYAVRRALISNGLNSGDEVVLANPPRVSYTKVFTTADLGGDWAVVPAYPLTATLFNGQVHWSGRVTGEATGDASIIPDGVLPVVMIPSALRVCLAWATIGDILTIGFQGSSLSGRVLASLADAAGSSVDLTSHELIFDGVSYRI